MNCGRSISVCFEILKEPLHLLQGDYNYSLLSGLLGDGIFTVDGDKWRQQRKISSYEFSTKVLRDFSSVVFRRNAAKLADTLSKVATVNQVVDMQVNKFLNLIKISFYSFD